MARERLERERLLDQVRALREHGLTVRAIAAELGIHPSKAQRALKALQRRPGIDPPPAHTVIRDSSTVTRDSFVGREREMGELKASLEDAFAGRGRLVMLVGEPGIGKTRTAQELALHAEREGAQVLWGWCYEEAGAPPYWPWVQPLRSYIHQQDSNRLRQQMGPGASDIAGIIPEVREKVKGLKPPPALEPEQARFRLFDSMTTFLKNASQRQPLVLVLDDLHWADRPSLLLLRFLARQMAGSRLLVVGCYRDVELSRQHPLSEALVDLAREPIFQRKPLSGLTVEDTRHFIEKTAGVEAVPGVVEAIYARAEGNPFFMSELVRLLGDQGSFSESVTTGTPNTMIPEGVREAIGHRLNRLSGQCNQLLTVAAVVGREFSLEQLRRLGDDLTGGRLLELLEEALAARIIEEAPGSSGSFQFCHALIQETLISELSAARRARLHARIGEALEDLYAASLEDHASELAHHFTAAEPELGPGKLVRYSLLAGEQALAAYGWEEALRHFERGLVARGVPVAGAEPAPDADSAALLFGLGRAQAATLERHRRYEMVNTMRRAFDYYLAAADVTRALAVAECPFPQLHGSTGTAQLLAEALTLVPPDSYQAGRLLARYGLAVGSELGDYEGAINSLERSLAIARREADTALEWSVLSQMGNVHHSYLRDQESLECSRKAIEVGRRFRQAHADRQSDPHWNVLVSLIGLGDIKGAWPYAKTLLTSAEEHRGRFRMAQALHAHEVLAYLEGQFQMAREFSDRGLEVAPRDARLVPNRAKLEYQLGEFHQGDAYLERLLETMRFSTPGPVLECAIVPLTIGVAAYITGEQGRFQIAEAAASPVLASPSVVPLFAKLTWTGLALLAVLRSDVADAEKWYGALKPWANTLTLLDMAQVDRVLGLLADTMGRPDQASAHFEDALAFCRRAGYQPELAWTCHDYAVALLQRNGAGDRSRATALLEESLAISSGLGMGPLTQRVSARLEPLEAQPAPAPVYPAGLTRREVDVLLLIAQGKSSRDVANELVLSQRTVQRHIANLYAKINARNRAEATTFALTHLVTPPQGTTTL